MNDLPTKTPSAYKSETNKRRESTTHDHELGCMGQITFGVRADLTLVFDASLIVSRLDENESDSVTNIIRNNRINRLCYFKKESKQEHS